MSELTLARLLRGAHRRTVEDVAALVPGGVCVEDASGRALVTVGELDGAAASFAIEAGERVLGVARGGPEAERVARLVAHLFAREEEKVALAKETLGRYKELTVLYDLGDALSRVLDVSEIARRVVEEAARFLQAPDVVLYVLGDGRDTLEPVAEAGEPHGALRVQGEGLESRVLRTGRAELVEDVGDARCSLLCAPLRSGEQTVGLLRVSSPPAVRWTASELKLVTSLAGSGAAAISHAMLHREQLHKQALRSRVERFVSPAFVEEAFAGFGERAWEGVAVLFCDLTEARVSSQDPSSAEHVVDALGLATFTALDVLLAHGATVNAEHVETLVAIFPHEDGFSASAAHAADAALELARRLSLRHGGPFERAPGVGIARGVPDPHGRHASVFRGIGASASLQAMASGRVLVDPDVAQALHGLRECVALARPDAPAYEVRP